MTVDLNNELIWGKWQSAANSWYHPTDIVLVQARVGEKDSRKIVCVAFAWAIRNDILMEQEYIDYCKSKGYDANELEVKEWRVRRSQPIVDALKGTIKEV